MYNIKIIEYPAGGGQIRLFDCPVGIVSKKDILEYEIEPFSGQEVRVIRGNIEDNTEDNLKKSLARTRGKIGMYARCVVWEWFATLTFDPKRSNRKDFRECMKKLRNWLHNVRKRYAPELKYLAVPELHADGIAWHVHLLMADTGGLPFSDSKRRSSGQKVYNISGWRWGFSTATKVRDTYRVSRYITKYMTKDCHALAVGAHRYYTSQNLPTPNIITMLVSQKELDSTTEIIVDSLGYNIVKESEVVNDYATVRYIDLQ